MKLRAQSARDEGFLLFLLKQCASEAPHLLRAPACHWRVCAAPTVATPSPSLLLLPAAGGQGVQRGVCRAGHGPPGGRARAGGGDWRGGGEGCNNQSGGAGAAAGQGRQWQAGYIHARPANHSCLPACLPACLPVDQTRLAGRQAGSAPTGGLPVADPPPALLSLLPCCGPAVALLWPCCPACCCCCRRLPPCVGTPCSG